MHRFKCPACGHSLKAPNHAIGRQTKFSKCYAIFPIPDIVSDDDAPTSSEYKPLPSAVSRPSIVGLISGVIMGIVGIPVGYLLAHHAPLYGDFVSRVRAEPFSLARESLVPGHIALCSIGLAAIGFFVAYLLARKA